MSSERPKEGCQDEFDIDWTRSAETEYEARLRRAFLDRFIERESRLLGPGSAYLPLLAFTKRYKPVADDLREALDECRRRRDEESAIRERTRYAELLQQARADVLSLESQVER